MVDELLKEVYWGISNHNTKANSEDLSQPVHHNSVFRLLAFYLHVNI